MTVAVKDNDEVELILAKLHCIEFSSEKLLGALDATRSELQAAKTEQKSLCDQLTTDRQRCQQLQTELNRAEDTLHKEVCTSVVLHRESKKQDTIVLSITSPNVYRFYKCFHCKTVQ